MQEDLPTPRFLQEEHGQFFFCLWIGGFVSISPTHKHPQTRTPSVFDRESSFRSPTCVQQLLCLRRSREVQRVLLSFRESQAIALNSPFLMEPPSTFVELDSDLLFARQAQSQAPVQTRSCSQSSRTFPGQLCARRLDQAVCSTCSMGLDSSLCFSINTATRRGISDFRSRSGGNFNCTTFKR